MGRGLAWIGVIVFVISWFVPVVKDQDSLSTGQDKANEVLGDLNDLVNGSDRGPSLKIVSGPSWLPGWQACHFAWKMLTGDSQTKGDGKDAWKATALGATSMTNVFMLLAILVLLGPKGSNTLLGVLLLASAVLDAGWLYLTDGEFRSGLRAGYYLWLASFAVVGIAFLRSRDRGALHPA